MRDIEAGKILRVVALSFAKTLSGGQVIDLSTLTGQNRSSMVTVLLHLVRLLPVSFAKTPSGEQVVDLSALIWRKS